MADRCSKCGYVLFPTDTVCDKCGAKVQSIQKTSQVVNTSDSEKNNSNGKTVFIISGIIAAFVIMAVIGFFLVKNSKLNYEEKIVYDCVTNLKKYLKDPESLQIYDDAVVLIILDANGNFEDAYTYIDYGAKNGFGGMGRSTAMFVDGLYLGDYDSKALTKTSNLDVFAIDEFEKKKISGALYYEGYFYYDSLYDEVYVVKMDKIKRKLKIK